MKRAYMKPTMQLVEIQHSHIICDNGSDVINPGQPNQPAGARRRNHDEWDDEDDWEED